MPPERKPAVPQGSYYITPESARQAIRLATPMIEEALGDRDVVGSGFLYLVVMDPARPPGIASFEQAILYEHAFGDCTQWDADYAGFARLKARLSWSLGHDTRSLQYQNPHLLRSGDTVLVGGVCIDGVVVAASGAFPVYDEIFAGTVALCLRGLALKAREAETASITLGH